MFRQQKLVLMATLVVLAISPLMNQPSTAFDMGLSPVKIEETLSPGTEKTVVYSFTNASTTSNIRIQVLVSDWRVDSHGNLETPKAGVYQYSASDWVEVSPAEFVCKPRETQLVRATYQVPADAKPGDYLTSLLFRQRVIVPPVKERSMGRLIPQGLVGSLATVIVPQTEKKAALESMKFLPGDAKQPPRLEIAIKNDGNTRIHPTGNLQILDKDGGTVLVKDFDDLGVVLRESTGLRELPIDKKLESGHFEAVLNLRMDRDIAKGDRGRLAFDIVPKVTAPSKSTADGAGAKKVSTSR
jgi:hypothetical protein